MTSYSDKIIPFDAAAASLSGQLEAKAISAGASPGMADAMIAGIAMLHGLQIITRNRKHFLCFSDALLAPEDVVALP